MGQHDRADAAWRAFRARAPSSSLEARAYAYGGCVIQDLGYYPFGSHFFSNLLHYVRTGDFIEALLRDAQDVDEYAFALGALGHYAADNVGHPHGRQPRRSADVSQAEERGSGTASRTSNRPRATCSWSSRSTSSRSRPHAYAPEAYHSFIGFQVAKPLLERAFSETYGIEMKDVFLNEDLAIGTYRHAVGTTIPEMTKVAWGKKRDEIRKVIPGAQKKTVVFNLRRRQYDKEFGADYEKPHGFARFLGVHLPADPEDRPVSRLQFLRAARPRPNACSWPVSRAPGNASGNRSTR